ncbi:TetR/AcrR family transcriptional regulator [Gordonia soli]|uniref:Putative TetR family transcriptional regulator n=1 Tax=Gordonia soli NBRC 108243 TaxID=1223545 RepID=M0QEP9_9ACTN|nr:TetR/AcrR family transcriptional regulator [Gordonia soli]GAC67083.1 putative TetR family transcriptional regulator [Gordonia soli NBRC 108243]
MPSRNATGRARPADRKRQLSDLAATLFLERGYSHVSVADIARAAGVTAPSVYRHFTDKQSLLAAAVLAGVDDLEAFTDEVVGPATADGAAEPGAEDTGPSTAHLVDAICDIGVTRPVTASLWRWSSTHLTEEQNKEVALRTRTVLHRWAAALFADDPDVSHRESVQITWAILSVIGSLSVHKTRIAPARAHEELRRLVGRLMTLRPDEAPPLPDFPSLSPVSTNRRDQILDAASALFSERGYADVGVDEIGAAVGITGPSVYKHFPSKMAILVSIGQRSGTRLEAGVMAAYASTADQSKLLALLVDSYVSVITSTADLSVSFNSSGVLHGELAGTELLDVQRRYVGRWIDLLCEIDPELRRPQAAVAVHAALSIVNDAVRMRRGRTRARFPDQMAYLMQGVLDL